LVPCKKSCTAWSISPSSSSEVDEGLTWSGAALGAWNYHTEQHDQRLPVVRYMPASRLDTCSGNYRVSAGANALERPLKAQVRLTEKYLAP